MIAFSTTYKVPHYPDSPVITRETLSDTWLDDLFASAIEATQEAILNALVVSKTTIGRNGNTAYDLPVERLRSLLKN